MNQSNIGATLSKDGLGGVENAQLLVDKAKEEFQMLFLNALVNGTSKAFTVDLTLPGLSEKRTVVITVACVEGTKVIKG